MKNLLKTGLILLVVFLCLPGTVDAQRKSDKRDNSVRLADRLWYGGGFGLSFGSGGYLNNFTSSEFSIGISPMVGYKFTEWLSAGPRVELTYLTGRYKSIGGGQVYKLNTLSYGVGPFLRGKTPFNIFGHVEYQFYDLEYTDGQITAENKLRTFRQTFDAFYVGAGYTSSDDYSRWGYEIYIVYDLLAPEDIVALPIDIRFGITYNF